ncbi:MAG: hypothetical protein R3E87_20965 [Burkholderiaceae bacterium]
MRTDVALADADRMTSESRLAHGAVGESRRRALKLAAVNGALVAWVALGEARAASGRSTRVEIFDRGLNLPVYRLDLPPGWTMRHFIATDLNDVWRMYTFYAVDFTGPGGEFVTYLTPTAVYVRTGQHWESMWLSLFNERVGVLGRLWLGETRRIHSPALFPNAVRLGIPVFEREIAGSIGNQPVQGRLFALVADLGYAVILYPHVAVAPRGLWPQMVEALQMIAASQTENPQVAARSRQIMQSRMQQAQASMQASRNWFNAFQSTMRQASELRSQNNREFGLYLRSQHRSYQGSDYTTNDMFTDYLRDTTTFRDPYTGYQVAQPGQYEYWYTDSLGHYYGTDDPNFDPNSLTGNWTGIAPLRP